MYSYTKILIMLLCATPFFASAATITLDPTASTYAPGDTFIETVRITTEGDCINAVNVGLAYPKDMLRAVDFSRGDSIFSLWAVEPKINTELGTVEFAGGIPGGYCGRITGDAGITNVLGKVIFTVVGSAPKKATVHFLPSTAAYVNDGAGTLAKLFTTDATIAIVATSTLSKNEWLSIVSQDTTPPQLFEVQVESTSGVFGGMYYLVFSTTDKESGLDHFEIFEDKTWKRITSPYVLKNQSLLGVGDIRVRAIDKAGNIRTGDYTAAHTPKRQLSFADFLPFTLLGLVVLLVFIKRRIDHKKLRPRS